MDLSVEPSNFARSKADFPTFTRLGNKATVEGLERVHHAVWMLVRLSDLPRFVSILQNPDALVFEDHFVLIRIRTRRVCQLRLAFIPNLSGRDATVREARPAHAV
jgi:hypothetical protein